jgi:cytochrome P450
MTADEDGTPRDDWDPLDPDALADPHAVHRRLRRECPVPYSGRWGGFYSLTRHADIVAASRDSVTFTATRQTVIPASPRKGLPRLPLQLDPPEHGHFRRGLNIWFKESRMQRLEQELEALAAALWEKLPRQGRLDFAKGFAAPFTRGALCLLVGLGLDEAERLGKLSHDYVHAVQGEELKRASELSREVDRFAIDLVADRKARPRDPETDMVTGLLALHDEGRRYTHEEVAGMVRLLLIGGHVVPKNFLGAAVHHVGRDHALQQRLRTEPSLMRSAIEELLRVHSPNQALVRVTTRSVEIGGRTIPRDSPVALIFLSANQDEEVFDRPDVFDAERWPNRHIAFGTGPHVCIGQSLARMQARITLGSLLQRTRRFCVQGTPQWARWTEYGVAELEIDVEPASGDAS